MTRKQRRRVEYGDLKKARRTEREAASSSAVTGEPGEADSSSARQGASGEAFDREFWDREKPPHWG